VQQIEDMEEQVTEFEAVISVLAGMFLNEYMPKTWSCRLEVNEKKYP
jgi:hypothetical protein